MKIYDISQEVFSCKVFPGDPAPSKNILCKIESGDAYNLSEFSMCSHNGTHVDAPLHFINGGKSVEQIPADIFVGFCFVAHHNGTVTSKDAKNILAKAEGLGAQERILIAGNATVSEDAAQIFADSGVLLLGNESQTVGPEDSPENAHRILLGASVVLLEGIRLDGIEEGRYILSAAPLNLGGLEGAPCRAVLIEL